MGNQIWQPTHLQDAKGRAQPRNNTLCQYFCLRESYPFSRSAEARQLRSSPYVPGAFSELLPQHWCSGRVNPSPSESMHGPLIVEICYSCRLLSYSATICCFLQPEVVRISFWHCSPLESLVWARIPLSSVGTSTVEIFFPILNYYTQVRPVLLVSLPLLPVSFVCLQL